MLLYFQLYCNNSSLFKKILSCSKKCIRYITAFDMCINFVIYLVLNVKISVTDLFT